VLVRDGRIVAVGLDSEPRLHDGLPAERRNIRDGADLLKLFTGSYVARGIVLPMPVENARAAWTCSRTRPIRPRVSSRTPSR
jgi:hypothetical protein